MVGVASPLDEVCTGPHAQEPLPASSAWLAMPGHHMIDELLISQGLLISPPEPPHDRGAIMIGLLASQRGSLSA